MTSASKLIRASLVLILSLSYLGYVFQVFSRAFWQSGLGDWIDPYFINYLLEHWYHSIAHFTDPSSPPMFLPIRRTLGYSHGLILYAPFYLLVRPALHPFVAYNLALLLVMETGVVCLYLLFRKFAGLSTAEACVLSAFFATSQNVIDGHMWTWSQRASVFLIPPILLLTLISLRGSRLFLAWLSGLLAALLLTQDFITALFALLLLILVAAPLLLIAKRAELRDFWMRGGAITKAAIAVAAIAIAWTLYISIFGGIDVRVLGLRIASDQPMRPFLLATVLFAFALFRTGSHWTRAFATGAIVGALVFLWIYLPAYRQHHAFSQSDLISALPLRDHARWQRPLDFIRDLHAYTTVRPFKLVFVVGILILTSWVKIDRNARLYALWFMLIAFVVLLVPIRFGDFSIWRTFFERLPAFSAIRDPGRIIYIYELVVVLVTALLLSRLTLGSRALITVVAVVMLVTERNRETFAFERPAAVYDRWVSAPIAIDPSCRSFFIKGASEEYMARSPHMWTLYGVDAMFVALKYSLPTLNGYSAWMPDGWELANPQYADYPEAVDRWIRRNALTDVCVFDIEKRTMRRHPTLTNLFWSSGESLWRPDRAGAERVHRRPRPRGP